jgi:hypothetical protein
MDYDLGYFDEDSEKFEPLDNPFGPEGVTHVFRYDMLPMYPVWTESGWLLEFERAPKNGPHQKS